MFHVLTKYIAFSMEEVKKLINESNSELSRSIKAIPAGLKREEVAQMIEKTTKTLPPSLKKEEVTQMIEKSLKSLPASLKKEEVIQLIDKATSNFLKTVKCKIFTLKRVILFFICSLFYLLFLAESSSCGEKVRDCEEQAKAGMEKLKKSIEENEKFFRKELWQIREQTGVWRQ